MCAEEHQQWDAAIIGGGVIGCSIAWRLAASGQRVVVLEKGELCAEATHAAGGMLAPLAEADETGDFFNLCVASRAMYDGFARELREASGIDIAYRTEGTLYLSLREEDDEDLDRRWQWQHAAGLNVKRLDAGCVRKLEPGLTPSLRWALKFPDDHQVDNRLLAAALIRAATVSGAELRTDAAVEKILTEPVAGKERVKGVLTSRGEVSARVVIIAAGCWSSRFIDSSDGPAVEPVRGQMVSFGSAGASLDHVIYSRRGYLIPRNSGLIIAGSTTERAGFDKSVTVGGMKDILEHATELMPSAKSQPIIETWAGLRPHSRDGLPLLGPDPTVEGLIHSTGHYRNGILLTPITAQAVSELVVKGDSSIDLSPFSINRQSNRRAAH